MGTRGLLVVVALALLVASCGDESPAVSTIGAPTTAEVTTMTGASTTTEAPTTSAVTTTAVASTTAPAWGTAPAATLVELVDGYFAALTDKDTERYRGLVASPDRSRALYSIDDEGWAVLGTVYFGSYDPAYDDMIVERLGELIVSGDTVTVPSRWTLIGDEETWVFVGFFVDVTEPVPGGFLHGGGAVFFTDVDAAVFVDADPAMVGEILTAQAAAWADGDIDGVLAGYAEQASYVDGFNHLTRRHNQLAGFYAGIQLEFTGEPVISGPLVAVATRVTDLASGVSSDGISIYWIEDGLIRLHTLTTGD
jgi:hypothetical protein